VRGRFSREAHSPERFGAAVYEYRRNPISFGSKREVVTITEVYDTLPLAERTLRRRRPFYPFKLRCEPGSPSKYKVSYKKAELGIVAYYKGRKLPLVEQLDPNAQLELNLAR